MQILPATIGAAQTVGVAAAANETVTADDVIPAAATALTVNLPSDNILAGGGFAVSVDATDPNGQLDPSYSGAVTLSLLNNAGAALNGTLTVTAAGGVATFNSLTIDNAGAGYLIEATAASLAAGVSSAFAAYTDQFVVTTQPQDTVAARSGAGFGVVVTAQNAAGVTDASFNGGATLTALSSPDGLPTEVFGASTVSAVNGVATFSGLNISQSGFYNLAITGNGIGPATSNTFMVSAGSATQLVVITPPPTDITATAPFEVDFAAEDALGNIDTNYGGIVTLALPAGAAPGTTLGGNLTVASAAGIAAFPGLTISQPASISGLQATTPGLGLTTTPSFVATAVGAASLLSVTTPPPDAVTAGVPFGLVVTAEDGLGNVDPSFHGNVTLSQSSGGAIGGTLVVAAVNGVATFSGLTLDQAADADVLVAMSPPLVAATAGPIVVNPASATQLSVSLPSVNVQPGVPFSITVSASDPFDNTDQTFTGPVTISLVNGGNSLVGQLTQTAVAGIATFPGLSIASAGTGLSIGATSSAGIGMSDVFDVTNDVFVVTTPPPQSVQTGDTFGFTVSAETGAGAIDTSFTGPVTAGLINLGTNAPTLSGTLLMNAVNGVATFSGLSINQAGAYELFATSAGVGSAFTGELDVSATPAPSTTTIAASAASAPFGLPVVFTAAITSSSPGNTPTGTVTFNDGAIVLGTAQLESDGNASLPIASLPAGADNVTATYGGDSADAASTSPALTENVGLQSTVTPSLGGFVLPATAVAGQPIKAKLPVVITNGGASVKGNFNIILFIDKSAGLDGNQVQVAKLSAKVSLKSGKSRTLRFTLKSLPASLTAGTYTFFTEIIDPSGATDVVASQPVSVQVPTVTLSAIAGAVKPAAIKLDHVGVAIVTITNTGNIDAIGTIDILLNPSTDGSTPISGITLAMSHKKVHLRANKTMTFRISFKVTASLTAGSYDPFLTVTLGGASTTAVGPTFTVD